MVLIGFSLPFLDRFQKYFHGQLNIFLGPRENEAHSQKFMKATLDSVLIKVIMQEFFYDWYQVF